MRTRPRWSRFMDICVAVIGGGSFGSAIAYHLANKYSDNKETRIILYCRNAEMVCELNEKQTNNRYCPDISFPQKLEATSSLEDAINQSDFLILAVPAQAMRSICRLIAPYLTKPVTIINLAKGIEMDTFKRMSIVIQEELKTCPHRLNIMTLSGPAFSRDILQKRPIGVTLAGKNKKHLLETRILFDTPLFDIKITKDIKGVELGGALKNVFAIMAGMMEGLEMGQSIYGDFLTRSIVDMKTISTYLGAKRATLDGRSGLGDLDITCTENSRNFRFGREYARVHQELTQQGKISGDVLEKTFTSLNTRTVEGYFTLKPIYDFCTTKNMFVPIINQLYNVLYENKCSPQDAIQNYRIQDKIRIRENRLTLSRVLFFLFPKLWYRREQGPWAWLANRQEKKAWQKLQN